MAFSGLTKSNLPLLSRLLRSESPRLASLRPPIYSEFLSNYSTSTDEIMANVRVPLPMFGLTGNYASALYISSVKSKSIDKVESELFSFLEASKKSTVYAQFSKDLSVPKKVRVKAIQDFCDSAKLSHISKNFLAVVAENGRLGYVDAILKKFKELTMAHRGEVSVSLTTAIPLPKHEENELKEALKEMVGNDKTIILEKKIDPSIYGGMIIEYNLKVFDMSIRTRANQMDKILNEPMNTDPDTEDLLSLAGSIDSYLEIKAYGFN